MSLGVMTPTKNATCAAPCFIQPKKDGAIRFLIYFREINKYAIRDPFPLPKIIDIRQSLGKFSFDSALDFSMGHYHLPLDE